MSDNQEKTPPDFSSLTENLSQQQAKISALKELVRQSEQQHGKNTASAQEKVKNIAQRLSNIKSKTARSKMNRSSSEISEDYSMSHIEEEEIDTSNIPSTSQSTQSLRARSETPGSEKISLLRKQMELNRMKMAERESKSKEIEQMVTQLKSKFESSQMSLERSVELGRSMGDLSLSNAVPSMLLHSQNRSFTISDVSRQQQLQPVNFESERIAFLEKRILQLESELSNKENVTETETLQKLEAKILDLEENVREKESIIEARTKAVSLLTENLSKKKKDVVDSLEETKQEMFKMQETFLDAELTYKKEVAKLNRVITEKSEVIKNLEEKCEILEKSRYDLTLENSDLKTKLRDVQDYSTKISELNKLNETLQKRISTLESQKYEFITEDEVVEAKSAEDMKRTEKDDLLLQKLKELEESLKKRDAEMEKLQEDLQEKTIDVNVANANMAVLQDKLNAMTSKSPLFSDETNVANEELQVEIVKLKQQLDDSNKSMIKNKLKMKQMQKQIDALQKSSDDNQEKNRLIEENNTLIQRVAELEEEMGSYQLQLVGKDKTDVELEEKVKVLETTCQNQITAIQLLEEQKMEIGDDLSSVKRELENSNIGELTLKIKELEEKIVQLNDEKDEINIKMNRYLNENMELLDKLEKLSKGSSAESIEMVNLLTTQEKLEIEQYQKDLVHKEDEVPVEISHELNESLRSLRLESSELMEKIELFTVERREVLEKLDALTIENQVLSGNLEHIQEEKSALDTQFAKTFQEKEELEKLVENLKLEKEEMNQRLLELAEHRTKLQEEINKLVKEELGSISPQSSPVKIAESNRPNQSESQSTSFDKEACEKLLKQLDSEIQNLNKNKDKNQKLKISKKLSDNAKNVHAMMTNLLIEFYKNLDECKQLREDLEKVKILLNNVSSDKNNEEVLNLQKLLEENTEKLNVKNIEYEKLQNRLEELQKFNSESYDSEISQLKLELEDLTSECSRKDDIIASLQDTIDALTNERDNCETEVQKQMELVADLRNEFDQLCADVKVNNQRLNEKSQELDQLQHEFDMRLKTSTNEVEILKTLVAEQKQLLIDSYQEHELDINQKMQEINNYRDQLKQLTAELEELKIQRVTSQRQESANDELQEEIKKLKDTLNKCNQEIENQREELLHKQETIDTLNTQIIDLYKTMEENSNKLIEKEDELQYIQEISDSNRTEIRQLDEKLSTADKTINDLREKLSSRTRELELMQQKSVPVSDPSADEKIKKLEADVQSLDAKNKEQLDKLKKYAANLKKKQAQCTDLEEKLASMENKSSDNIELNELKAKVIQYEEQLSMVKIENNKLSESLQKSSNQDEIDDLKWKLDEYENIIENKSREIDNLKSQLNELSDKCDQIEDSMYELQSQVQRLEKENSQYQTNIESMSTECEHVKKENQEISQKLAELESKDDKKKMEKLKAAVVQLKHKLADKKKETEELTAELNTLKMTSSTPETGNQQEIENLKLQIKELDEMNEKILNDTKVAYDNDIGLLKQKIEELESTNRELAEEKQRKVSLEGQLETFEMTNIELREKVARLEEVVASLDAERNALAHEKISIERELKEKDEIVSSKLRETESDNRQLNESLKEMNEERNSLLHKISSMEIKISSDAEKNIQHISTLEQSNQQLERQIEQVQQEMKKIHQLHEQALALKHSEIDEIESQFSLQLQKIESDKKSIQEALEKANDQIIDFQDEVVRLKDNVNSLENARSDLEREMSWLKLQNDNYTQDQLENEQLRMQLMLCETELENLKSQNETIASNHDAEVLILRQQITDLEAMRSQVSQNQTDDQVMLQNENVKLKELLIEKENEIQQKAIQLQMATVFDAPVQASNDPFANLSAPLPSNSTNDIKSLEEKIKQSQEEIGSMREAQLLANMELDMQSGKIQELLQENKKLHDKINEMQSMMDNLIRTNVELESSNERQKNDIERKDKEINEIKMEMSALRDTFNQSAQSTDDDKFHALQTELAEKNHAIENLQKILEKYETSTQQISSNPLSTAMFFDDPQPSTISLFDDPFVDMNRQPVSEEIIQPKKAYLLYDSKNNVESQTEESWLVEYNEQVNKIIILQSQLAEMEQKVMEQYMELETQRQRICELETLERSQITVVPKVDDKIVPQKAYLCYNNAETQTSTEWTGEFAEKIEELQTQIEVMKVEQSTAASQLFEDKTMSALEIEDGWSWGADNVSVEPPMVQTQVRASLLSPRSDLEVKLQEQRDIVEQLERERDAFNEELQSLRENSKKMMKKLKEYQQKIKELETRRGSSADLNDMNDFIQAELNSQVQMLENKLKEVINAKEKEQQEKENLLKKIEVLTNANERMIEMKERQDSQLELYQLKIKDLSQKIHSLEEWQEDSQKPVQPTLSASESLTENVELTRKIQELTDQVKDIQADNDELQALLDEEKNNNRILEEKLVTMSSNKQQENDEFEKLSKELQVSQSQSQRIAELEKINNDLLKEKSNMEHELQVLNDHVLASLEFEDRMKNTVFELDAKNMEIQMLKATLEKIQSQPTHSDNSEELEKLRHEKEQLESNMKTSIDLLNAQWSQMVEQRGNEVANSWKQHLEMRETEFSEIEATLRKQLEEKKSSPDSESENADVENETLSKMKAIMESQEVEIVSLKEQLAIRSAEYAALSAKVDPYHQMSTSMNVSPISSADADKVPRSELDLALYMLHQRDMRLEEMTMELVRLLEERDQLQLRLSNAIRQLEDIKRKMNIEMAESSDQSTPEKSTPVANVEDDKLKAKLSELNTVQHLRDKAIADDREKRFIEHISMFQRDVANIPHEAAARIVQSSDQSQQSPSSVLMNWILGKKPESP